MSRIPSRLSLAAECSGLRRIAAAYRVAFAWPYDPYYSISLSRVIQWTQCMQVRPRFRDEGVASSGPYLRNASRSVGDAACDCVNKNKFPLEKTYIIQFESALHCASFLAALYKVFYSNRCEHALRNLYPLPSNGFRLRKQFPLSIAMGTSIVWIINKDNCVWLERIKSPQNPIPKVEVHFRSGFIPIVEEFASPKPSHRKRKWVVTNGMA